MKNSEALKTTGEVSKHLDIPAYVIRFWEKKFSLIAPIKVRGNRYYDKKQLMILEKVKTLLYENKYSIKGAQKVLYAEKNKSKDLDKQRLITELKLLKEEIDSFL